MGSELGRGVKEEIQEWGFNFWLENQEVVLFIRYVSREDRFGEWWLRFGHAKFEMCLSVG